MTQVVNYAFLGRILRVSTAIIGEARNSTGPGSLSQDTFSGIFNPLPSIGVVIPKMFSGQRGSTIAMQSCTK